MCIRDRALTDDFLLKTKTWCSLLSASRRGSERLKSRYVERKFSPILQNPRHLSVYHQGSRVRSGKESLANPIEQKTSAKNLRFQNFVDKSAKEAITRKNCWKWHSSTAGRFSFFSFYSFVFVGCRPLFVSSGLNKWRLRNWSDSRRSIEVSSAISFS